MIFTSGSTVWVVQRTEDSEAYDFTEAFAEWGLY